MHKVYMSDVVFFEVEVREKLIEEMREREISSFKEVLNSVLKEYFEIKGIIKGGLKDDFEG